MQYVYQTTIEMSAVETKKDVLEDKARTAVLIEFDGEQCFKSIDYIPSEEAKFSVVRGDDENKTLSALVLTWLLWKGFTKEGVEEINEEDTDVYGDFIIERVERIREQGVENKTPVNGSTHKVFEEYYTKNPQMLLDDIYEQSLEVFCMCFCLVWTDEMMYKVFSRFWQVDEE